MCQEKSVIVGGGEVSTLFGKNLLILKKGDFESGNNIYYLPSHNGYAGWYCIGHAWGWRLFYHGSGTILGTAGYGYRYRDCY